MYYEKPSLSDRLASAFTYVTGGWIGIIWMVILYFMNKRASKFLRFNVMQSIFFAIIYYILYVCSGAILTVLSKIPIIQILVSWIQLLLFKPIIAEYSLLQIVIDIFVLYLFVFSILGRYPKVYKISKFIEKNA
ncbi:hypothetical protein J6G99_06440 [bacterium]|nr:hypothetical protein [bacterium]